MKLLQAIKIEIAEQKMTHRAPLDVLNNQLKHANNHPQLLPQHAELQCKLILMVKLLQLDLLNAHKETILAAKIAMNLDALATMIIRAKKNYVQNLV